MFSVIKFLKYSAKLLFIKAIRLNSIYNCIILNIDCSLYKIILYLKLYSIQIYTVY